MLTLEAAQTIRAVAGTATAVTYTIFGDAKTTSDAFKVLAQGQLPSSVGTLYTVPGSTTALVKSIRLANATGSAVTGIKFYVGGTAAANQITGTFEIPANGTASLAGDRVEILDAAGALVYAGIVPTSRQVIAGSALTGGGALTADVTLDVGVDGSTIEVNADALRVKDAGITGAKIASSVALAGSPTTTTQSAGDNSTKVATTAYVDTADALKAPLASPTFTGDPKAPTPAVADNDTSIATTAYVQGELALTEARANRIATGQEVFARGTAATTTAMTSGTLRLTYFTAYRTETINSLASGTGATAAATPTTCKMGLYTVDAGTGDLTRVGITANDTTIWAATNTKYTKAMTGSVNIVAGTRYVFACLYVGTTAPVLSARTVPQALASDNNRMHGSLASQTDIPSSITAASLAVAGVQVYGELIP